MQLHDQSSLLQMTRRSAASCNGGAHDDAITGAFLAAYLLTGSAAASEAAVEKAIEKWDPRTGAPALILETATVALSRSPECLNDFPVPVPLQRVMELPGCMRRCFILRLLVGLTATATARLLSLSARYVDQCTSAAMRLLAGQTGD